MMQSKTPHTCLFCPKVFSGYRSLERHMHCHTEERPFDCRFCRKEFRRMEQITRHQFYCQLNPKPLCKVYVKCSECLVRFSSKANLSKHKRLKRCKGKPFGKESGNTTKKGKMEVGTTPAAPAIPKWPIKCDKCSVTFSSLRNLKRHISMKKCESRQRKARLAMRRPPSLKIKLEVVNGLRVEDLVCEKCNAKFKWYTSLRRHRKADACTPVAKKMEKLDIQVNTNTCTTSPVAKKIEKLDVVDTEVISTKKYGTRAQTKSRLSVVDKSSKTAVSSSMPSATPSKTFPARCIKCSSEFISRAVLKQHYVESHDMKLWSCKLCPDWYCRFDGLVRHMRRRHKRKMDLLYLCKLCGLKFATLDFLKRHKMARHVKRRYECGVCHYTYNRTYNLREHVQKTGHSTAGDDDVKLLGTLAKAPDQEKKGTPERKSQRVIKPVTPFSPSVSPVNKPEEKHVTRSMPSAIPSKTRRARCLKCSSKFGSRAFLKQHYIKSHGMKLWNCKLCPDWYCGLDGLKRHVSLQHEHEMDQFYLCKLCQRKFALLDSLKVHETIHHAKKNHECGICHYTYTRVDGLREHYKNTGHGTDGDGKLPVAPSKATEQEKKRTSERKSQRVVKPVTPFSPSVSPVAAKNKRASSPSPDITKPKFYTETTATKPKSQNKLGSKEKPRLKRSKSKFSSTTGSSSSSLLRPPVFQYNKQQVFTPLPDAECPKLEFLPSPVTSPSQVQLKNLRQDILNQFHEQQQQKRSQPWDESFFLHMNRYTPES